MRSRKIESFKWQMIELPNGISTSNGNWYHITSDQIDKYTPDLLKEVSLEKIIKNADAWVKSPDALSLILFFFMIFFSIDPLLSFILSILFYLVWYFNTSVFISLVINPIIRLVTKDGFLYTISAILLIGISMMDKVSSYIPISIEFDALWYGVGLFFMFKVGLLRLFLKFIQIKFKPPKVEMQDRILNMLLIRYGMKFGILTGKLDDMQNRLIEVANYHKTKKK